MKDVGRAFRERGGLLLDSEIDGELCAKVVKAAHDFFELPRAVKEEIAIERSPHFRGWSEMHNERDWREQIHLGREREPMGLDGPNLWPPDQEWRRIITTYMDAVADLGERVLAAAGFAGVARDGYLLLKLIGYHPQAAGESARSGVAAHVDFSWITLTLQDSPGLEIMRPDETWTHVEPIPGALWIHPGELLEVASGGAYRATPHRVINPSLDRTRVSLPLFLNPPLSGRVMRMTSAWEAAPRESAHVHRVLPQGVPIEPFVFGEAEWKRKGLNGWCHLCAP